MEDGTCLSSQGSQGYRMSIHLANLEGDQETFHRLVDAHKVVGSIQILVQPVVCQPEILSTVNDVRMGWINCFQGQFTTEGIESSDIEEKVQESEQHSYFSLVGSNQLGQ